jgi:uncharacterized protein (TIGR02145 family)
MKNFFRITFVILLFVASFLSTNCKKNDPAKLATLSTTPVSNVNTSTATGGGSIINNGGAEILANGVCWSTNVKPTTTDSKTVDEVGAAQFVSSINNLTPGTTYHVRAYATNSIGTAYGADLSFSTLAHSPSAVTQSATNITITDATLNGTVNANDLSTTVSFEYGLTTSYGQTITAIQSPVTGNTNTSVTASVTGLSLGTTYHYRIKGSNSFGTSDGNDMSFTTLNIPLLETDSISSIQYNSAISGGNISSDGGTTVTAKGVCWSTSENPTTLNSKTDQGTGMGAFTSSITELLPNTTYYVRAYATNSVGTAYGNQISFETHLTDIEGNAYNTATIGTQIWMAENLKTTKYNDGTNIIYITEPSPWAALTSPAYCWYNSDPITYNNNGFGALYNWYVVDAVTNGNKNVCPTGWHVPSDEEWTDLTDFLGGESVAGGKLKESGTTHWQSPNVGATNESGFTALPGGYRHADGTFNYVNILGGWWSSTESSITNAWYRHIGAPETYVSRISDFKKSGFSVRCIKD